ncbi:ankyrin repeat and protein kinase domain-containing protein 1-like [Oscarella lobularis]|uniref:ankyrin repeat and protein kinase domain-containing protein 1-like n=1 Tax=Oscarella lobularis TaxID=121494 RepID=UPI00331310CD
MSDLFRLVEKANAFSLLSSIQNDEGNWKTYKNCDGYSLLHVCAQLGRPDCLKVLLQQPGVNPGVETRFDRRQPIHLAALNGRESCLVLLLNRGADPNASDATRTTPLHLAASRSDSDRIVRRLLDAGARVDVQTKDGWAPLHEASRTGHVDAVRLLTERGSALEFGGVALWQPLHMAASLGRVDAVDVLLRAGANADCVGGPDGNTPLIEAIYHDQFGSAQHLLAHNADTEYINERGQKALGFAIRKTTVDFTQLLLDWEANVDAYNSLQGDVVCYAEEWARRGRSSACLTALLRARMERGDAGVCGRSLCVLVRDGASTNRLCSYINACHSLACLDFSSRALDGVLSRDVGRGRGSAVVEENVGVLLAAGAELNVTGTFALPFAFAIVERNVFWNEQTLTRFLEDHTVQLASVLTSLKSRCRFVVRRALGPSRLCRVHELPIGWLLKRYLLFGYPLYLGGADDIGNSLA